ncbi:phosphoribosyltransferase [Sphingomonas naphthae]|uniref:Phosphoribosyltransferase n=1 Tax=Sphingomonas naphthae TaxID=1813468 RepID=A0ABY7TM58_9SPHN|nr:phosphoribosyltransferase [Sphingomonas naphthae]WCT74326.1 phosphoribosyltransferase [Sphingomonas naphthae]
MEYRSLADLNDTVCRQIDRIPPDVSLVVGVPRSGLLAANLIALNLNLPLLDLEAWLHGLAPHVGRTVRSTMKARDRERVLVVDDSILSGESMVTVRERVAAARPDADVLYCAVYGAGGDHPEVDLTLESVAHPRIFQWNLMRHNRLATACFDIDGVLCADPEHHENDDGPLYEQFVLNARPLLVPGVRIGHLVTSRLERFRPQTEAWLDARGIEYDRLWMIDLPTAEERRRLKAHAPHKARVYRETGACLFVESEDRQAQTIAELSGLPVLSIEGQRMVWPDGSGAASRRRHAQRWTSPAPAARTPKAMAARIARVALGPAGYAALKGFVRGGASKATS